MNPPPFYNDWPGLAQLAERLLAARVAGDPEQVQGGRFTQAEADDRARIMGATIAIWRAVVRREPVPELAAFHAEIRLDLDAVRKSAAARLTAASGNTSFARQLTGIEALVWNHRPCMPGHDLPWILHVHAANQLGRESAPMAAA
jgi:hypothetical protein